MNKKGPLGAYIFFVFLQIADGLLSFHGIKNIGLYKYEGNPLMIYLSKFIGYQRGILITKILAILLTYFLYKRELSATLWFLSGVYFLNFIHQILFFAYFNGWIKY